MDPAAKFEAWIEERDREFHNYRTVILRAGKVPCSLEVIMWTAHKTSIEPAVLLRARKAQQQP